MMPRLRRLFVIAALGAALASAASAAPEATLVGAPTVSPSPLVAGGPAEVTVTLRADAKKATAPVALEVHAGKTPIGKLADAALGPNQTKTYRIAIKVPADAAKTLELRVLAWGTELGRARAAVKASGTPEAAVGAASQPARPATPPPVPSLTQTVTTAAVSVTGNRGSQAAAPPLPSLTQTVTTAAVSITGNRGAQASAPPVPSLTQTVTTPAVSIVGNR